MDIAYYPGCSLHASAELYDVQNKLVLKKLGINLKELDDWSCCGATSASKTNDFLSIALPARNLGIAEATGLTDMVIPCSSCYSRTLVSQARLENNPEIKDSINAELKDKVQGNINVLSINELLLEKVTSDDFKAREDVKPLKGLKPVSYYGCLMTRFPCDMDVPDDMENPMSMDNIVKALGATPVDWAYKTDCCGASASVNDNEVAIKLMGMMLKDAAGRDANCIVTSCPMCQFNLDAYQDKVCKKFGISKRLPVYFITELVGFALGINYSEMQVDRHMVEAVSLVKELELI